MRLAKVCVCIGALFKHSPAALVIELICKQGGQGRKGFESAGKEVARGTRQASPQTQADDNLNMRLRSVELRL